MPIASPEPRSTAPVMGRSSAIWSLRSEHSGAFLRLQRLLDGRQSFTLCFLTYSDRAYRDEVADFLGERLGARVRISIDSDDRIGTESLFEKLSAGRNRGPAQLTGLELWPEGLDDLLGRLNHRRGALAERCARPLLMWIRSRDLRAVATRAADLWAWRSGVFDFVLPVNPDHREPHRSYGWAVGVMDASRRHERIGELRQFIEKRSSLRPIDVDLMLDLGDLHKSLGETEEAEAAYLRARVAVASMDDRRRRAITEGKIADIFEARGELDEALRIRIEEELPVYERLGDVRSVAVTQGQIADILQARGELDEALRIRIEEELPVYERLGDVRSRAIAQGQIADILQARGELDEALRIYEQDVLPDIERIKNPTEIRWVRERIVFLRSLKIGVVGC